MIGQWYLRPRPERGRVSRGSYGEPKVLNVLAFVIYFIPVSLNILEFVLNVLESFYC